MLSARFDRIFSHKTGFATLDRLLTHQRANKSELLKVLERPDIPLHTNGSENDVRCHVHQAQDQRRNPLRHRPRLPRRLPRPPEDLRQERRQILGLPRRPASMSPVARTSPLSPKSSAPAPQDRLDRRRIDRAQNRLQGQPQRPLPTLLRTRTPPPAARSCLVEVRIADVRRQN